MLAPNIIILRDMTNKLLKKETNYDIRKLKVEFLNLVSTLNIA